MKNNTASTHSYIRNILNLNISNVLTLSDNDPLCIASKNWLGLSDLPKLNSHNVIGSSSMCKIIGLDPNFLKSLLLESIKLKNNSFID